MNAPMAYTIVPVGHRMIGIIMEEKYITQVLLAGSRPALLARLKQMLPHPIYKKSPAVEKAFTDYLQGRKSYINVPFKLYGVTKLQKRILQETRKIPYGQCVFYGTIAKKIGNKHLSRVVGSSLAKNPIPLIIPCHRVIRADGNRGGFMGNLIDRTGWKKLLLMIEQESTKI